MIVVGISSTRRSVIAPLYGNLRGIIAIFGIISAAGAYFNFAFVADVSGEAVAVISAFLRLEVAERREIFFVEFGFSGDACGAVAAVEGGNLRAGCEGAVGLGWGLGG